MQLCHARLRQRETFAAALGTVAGSFSERSQMLRSVSDAGRAAVAQSLDRSSPFSCLICRGHTRKNPSLAPPWQELRQSDLIDISPFRQPSPSFNELLTEIPESDRAAETGAAKAQERVWRPMRKSGKPEG